MNPAPAGIHCPPVEKHAIGGRIHPVAGGIHSIACRMNPARDRINAINRHMNATELHARRIGGGQNQPPLLNRDEHARARTKATLL